jgi:hypothetical protein
LPPAVGARRLFAAEEEATLLAVPPAPRVIARLLEDGDSADLRALLASMPLRDLRIWVDRHGARQLSRRSLAFWQVLLALPGAATPAPRNPYWLL